MSRRALQEKAVESRVRDAIVLSGWTWDAFNTPERVALALVAAGAKVLYCERPVSRLKHRGLPLQEIIPGIFAYGPVFAGHPFNRIPLLHSLQCKILVKQILAQAERLNLRDPLFVYPHLQDLTPVCREMKKRGRTLVHLCIDYPESYQWEQIGISDFTLVVAPSIYAELSARYPAKVHLIPQPYYGVKKAASTFDEKLDEPKYLSAIPRPRLAYLGPAHKRLNVPMLETLLRAHPQWHFITFGGVRCSALPNVHCVGWRNWQDIPSVAAAVDVGLMPYDLDTRNLHCVPLKLFDFFAAGTPVVSTPILYVRHCEELVYVGETAQQIEQAIQAALDEPPNSVKRERRKGIASDHSVIKLTEKLREILPLYGGTSARDETDRNGSAENLAEARR